jgi:hypothetical protein
MTLQEKLTYVKQSEISKLKFNNSILGLRTKYFDVNTDTFEYYDFELDVIKNQKVRNFINSLNMNSIELHRDGNGLLISDDEEKNNVIVKEFKDEEDAIRVLSVFPKIYKYKGVGQ